MRKTRKCGYCGKEFTVANGTKKYCCASCARKAETERHATASKGLTTFFKLTPNLL